MTITTMAGDHLSLLLSHGEAITLASMLDHAPWDPEAHELADRLRAHCSRPVSAMVTGGEVMPPASA